MTPTLPWPTGRRRRPPGRCHPLTFTIALSSTWHRRASHSPLIRSCASDEWAGRSAASPEGAQYVCKTAESFKLADLYWLEACIMARCQERNRSYRNVDEPPVERLAFHRPTASHLLGCAGDAAMHEQIDYPDEAAGEWHDAEEELNEVAGIEAEYDPNVPLGRGERIQQSMTVALPFRRGHFQYVARVVAAGQSPEELLKDIEKQSSSASPAKPWVLEYDTMQPLQNPTQPTRAFISAMLMCAVARKLPGEPLLTPADPEKGGECIPYLIVETAERLYLAQKMSPTAICNAQSGYTTAIAKDFREAWSRRPFQYSGSINLDAALTIVDMLWDMLRRKRSESHGAIRILDPTCGSGTFLALTLMAWGNHAGVEATGVDSNDKCAEGTVKNLKHLFPDAVHETFPEGSSRNEWTMALGTNRAEIHCKDSARLSTFASDGFDCAVANLPWNRNTFEYQGTDGNGTNGDILNATAAALKPGAPFVVISARDREITTGDSNGEEQSFNAAECLRQLGLAVLGEATIPPAGFELPVSGKKGAARPAKKKRKGSSSDCVITVAAAPQ